ncbi:MAG: GNAT family N-acetyltransferase [Clostridia bacterium]|nr:GNAT family N-acetyltransferase [Clostridia bacterium]
MSIRFVPMVDEYLEKAAEVYNYYIANTTVTFHTEQLTAEEMKPILYQDDPLYVCFAIFDDDAFCGYAYMAPYKKRQAYRISSEVTLYLCQEKTGKGIGTQALKLLEEHARKNGIHSFLAVICAENNQSIGLFNKNGYEKCAHFKEVGMKFDRMLDIVVMQKIID